MSAEADPSVLYENLDPVEYKRTLTLVNTFITTSSQFLNSFPELYESKIRDLDVKLNEVESILSIYEEKLSSIPIEAVNAPRPA